jgi:hypothetical protein
MMKESKQAIMQGVEAVTSKVIGSNTVEYTKANGDRVIRLHHTDIVTVRANGDIILNSGGWRTSTTKDRMNCKVIYPWRIYQMNKIWYVHTGDNKHVFADGITMHPDGTVTGAGPDLKTLDILDKKILAYVKGYMAALDAGKVPAPSNGDCWYCLMRTVDKNEPLGEATKSVDHIESHFKEKYYVPSLVMRAIEVFPVSQAAKWYLGSVWNNEEKSNWLGPIGQRQIETSLKRYLRRQFGLAA